MPRIGPYICLTIILFIVTATLEASQVSSQPSARPQAPGSAQERETTPSAGVRVPITRTSRNLDAVPSREQPSATPTSPSRSMTRGLTPEAVRSPKIRVGRKSGKFIFGVVAALVALPVILIHKASKQRKATSSTSTSHAGITPAEGRSSPSEGPTTPPRH